MGSTDKLCGKNSFSLAAMMEGKEIVGLCARIASTFATNTFFGAAIYINIVECPARLSLKTAPAMVSHFQATFPRARAMQGPLAGTSAMGAAIAWYLDSDPSRNLFLASSIMMLCIPPWTKLVIMPINNQLMDGEVPAKKEDKWVSDMMNQWDKVHLVRSILSGAAMCMMGTYWINKAVGLF